MQWQIWLATVLLFSGNLFLSSPCAGSSLQLDELNALAGEWTFVEDLTEGRSLEQLGPPMSSKFQLGVEDGVVILNGHGSGHRDVRIALDGATTEIKEPQTISRYRGSWQNQTFEYEVAFERLSGNAGGIKSIRRSFRMTPDGLLVTVQVEPSSGQAAVGLYRHAEDIAMPKPAPAVSADLAWLAGAWVGTKSTGSSVEERWSPPLGGALLATSRTVNKSGKMVAFEYLRIIERDGGLVYIAQPAGRAPTEFILSELTPKRAVFENPRHDYPRKIVYELSEQGTLTTSVGQLKGGTPQRVELIREGN
jgi:hypothetical protein